jgi:hypothetical protein
MCTRRDVLRSGLLASAACVAARAPLLAQVAPHRGQHGCLLEPGTSLRYMNGARPSRMYESGHEKVYPNSGDPDLDFALAQSFRDRRRVRHPVWRLPHDF